MDGESHSSLWSKLGSLFSGKSSEDHLEQAIREAQQEGELKAEESSMLLSILSLFGGCTHHGLEQLLDYTYSVLGIKQIDAFIGGLHLKGKSDKEIECNIEIARKYNVRRWIVNHCTGNDAIALWCNAFDSNPRDGYTGSRFEV